MTARNLENQVWLIANNKKTEFEYFCKQNDLKMEDPFSLQMFINEETVEERERSASFYSNGFFVCWKNRLRQSFRLFIKSRDHASFLHSKLLLDSKLNSVELYRVSKGKMNKVAWGGICQKQK